MLHERAVGLDRGHRLRELVVVVVEVARELERVLLCYRALAAAVDVRGLDRHVGHEARARRGLHPLRELERVPAAEHVGAERARVGVVERDARRAVHHVGELLAQPLELARLDPEVRLLDVALDEAEARGRLARQVEPLQQQHATLARGQDLHDLPGLAVADRLRAHDRDDLLQVGVGCGLGQELLAHEAGGPRQQHLEARALAERRELGARQLLQLRDARLDLPLRQLRRLSELEDVVAPRHSEQALHAPFVLRVPGELPHRAPEPRAEPLDPLESLLDQVLVARDVDQPAREELRGDLHRMVVAVRVDQQLGRLDGVALGLAALTVHLHDVLPGRHVDDGLGLARDGAPASPRSDSPARRLRCGPRHRASGPLS